MLATDNDQAGNTAAEVMAGMFTPMGATVERLSLPDDIKDLNQLLMDSGAVGVAAVLRRHRLYDC